MDERVLGGAHNPTRPYIATGVVRRIFANGSKVRSYIRSPRLGDAVVTIPIRSGGSVCVLDTRVVRDTSEPNVPRLVIIGPEEHEGLAFDLSGSELVIGHSDTADIVIDDPYLSRRHALISIDSDSGLVTVHDLKSTGGTFVNEERIERPRVLRPGDLVRFADLVARFQPGGSPTTPMAAVEATTQVLSLDTGTDTAREADADVAPTPASGGQPADHADASVAAHDGGARGAAAVRPQDVAPSASAPSSEYQSLTAALAALYPDRADTSQEENGEQDVTRASTTGWDARAVALAVLANEFSQITVPAPAASTDTEQDEASPAAVVSLRPEFYYALFRAGIPANANGLILVSLTMVRAIWRQASTQGIIPQALANDVPGAVARFHAISAAHSFDAVPPVDMSTLQEMPQTTIPETAQQEQFAELYAEHQGDWASFWPAVEEALGAGPAKQLQLISQLFHLTISNQPLVAALMAADADNALTSTLDLATRGYYDPAKWAPLIDASIPAGIPGADAEEQASNYAQLLAAQVSVAFPTAVLADQVRRHNLPVADSADIAGVADFLTSNQGQFEIGIEPVETYIARTGLTGTPAAVMTQVKRLQLVYQLTPDNTSLAVLLRHDLDSALAVTRYDPAGFVRRFADDLGGTDTATAIHAWATQVFALSRLPRRSPALFQQAQR
jgi:FHA domain